MFDASNMTDNGAEIAKMERLANQAESTGTPEAKASAVAYRRRAAELREAEQAKGLVLPTADFEKYIEGHNRAVSALSEAERTLIEERDRALAEEYNRAIVAKPRQGRPWESICTSEIYRTTDPARLPLQAPARRVIGWRYQRKGLILSGPTGGGKSRSAWLLLKRLHDEGRGILAFDGIGWFVSVSRAFRDMDTIDDWLDGLTGVSVLFLDDVFRGRLSEAQSLAMWGVIERRTSNGKPIIVTLNGTGESLIQEHGVQVEPIIRRLREFCESVVFDKNQKENP